MESLVPQRHRNLTSCVRTSRQNTLLPVHTWRFPAFPARSGAKVGTAGCVSSLSRRPNREWRIVIKSAAEFLTVSVTRSLFDWRLKKGEEVASTRKGKPWYWQNAHCKTCSVNTLLSVETEFFSELCQIQLATWETRGKGPFPNWSFWEWPRAILKGGVKIATTVGITSSNLEVKHRPRHESLDTELSWFEARLGARPESDTRRNEPSFRVPTFETEGNRMTWLCVWGRFLHLGSKARKTAENVIWVVVLFCLQCPKCCFLDHTWTWTTAEVSWDVLFLSDKDPCWCLTRNSRQKRVIGESFCFRRAFCFCTKLIQKTRIRLVISVSLQLDCDLKWCARFHLSSATWNYLLKDWLISRWRPTLMEPHCWELLLFRGPVVRVQISKRCLATRQPFAYLTKFSVSCVRKANLYTWFFIVWLAPVGWLEIFLFQNQGQKEDKHLRKEKALFTFHSFCVVAFRVKQKETNCP